MSSPAEIYVRGIHDKFNFYAAWPPNQPRELGDVGRLKDGAFQRITTLHELGINFKKRVGEAGQDLSHTSGNSVSVEFKGQGQTLQGANIPQAKAGAVVQFSAAGAFVFQVASPRVVEIENQVALAEKILGKFRTKKNGKRAWQADWFVITEVVTAEKVTVLLSNSKASKIELSAEGTIPVGPAPLAAVGGGLSVVTQKGDVTSVVAAAKLTPMFRLCRVRRSILDRILGGDESADLTRAAPDAGQATPQRVLEPVPVPDAMGNPTRAWAPAKRKRSARGRKKTVKAASK